MAIIRRGFNLKKSIPPLELIEYSVALEFNYRSNIIVPNVSWGISEIGHECDLLILRPSGYAVEIEIKRSLSDLKADTKKAHCHGSLLIRELWFCISDEWNYDECLKIIPESSGVLTYMASPDGYNRVGIRRRKSPIINANAKKFSEYQRGRLLHLASMRIWRMKKKIGENKHRSA